MKIQELILLLATVCAALMAGLFYSYSFSVNLGLSKLTDLEYLKAMQSINREIQNPIFFLCFFGVLIFLPASAFCYVTHRKVFICLLCAACTYFTGVFGVTVLGNVPLNDQLEAFDLVQANATSLQQQRGLFESRWNTLNHVRTASSLLTVLLLTCACLWTHAEE